MRFLNSVVGISIGHRMNVGFTGYEELSVVVYLINLIITRFDQLREQRNKHLVFEEFVEDTINFMPTYKYNPGK
jgi:hypothetical protein